MLTRAVHLGINVILQHAFIFLNTTISLVLPWKKGWPVVDHPHVLVATIGEATSMLRYILLLLLPCSMGMICKLPHAKQKMSNKQ